MHVTADEDLDSAARAGHRASPAEAAAMGVLRDVLDEVGYAQLYPRLAGAELFAPDRMAAAAACDELAGPERAVLRLFGLGLPLARRELPAHLAGPIDLLAAAGLAAHRDASPEGGAAGVATTGWVVTPALRGYLLASLPATFSIGPAIGAAAYVGQDSLRLAAALPPTAGRRVLDLGAGCGIQGLLAARGAAEAVLSDIEPFSLRAAALNVVLNAVEHPVRILAGDLYAPVEGERFDLVAVLPPYVPSVEGSSTSAVVDGGPDGLGFIRRVVAGAGAVLAERGELVALCQLLCDDDGPLLGRELEELAPDLEARLLLSDWHPLQPYVAELATRLAAHGARADCASLVTRYSASLRGFGVTGVATAAIRLRRTGRPGATVLGAAPSLRSSARVRPAPGLVIAPDPNQRTASADGRGGVLNGPSVALLAAIDGERSIPEVVAAAWGRPPGAHELDLVEQALERIGEFVRLGLVVLDSDHRVGP